MKWVHGQTLGLQLCKLFGLDAEKVESIAIICHVDALASVEVSYRIYSDEVCEMVEVFEKHRLTIADDSEEPF